MNPKEGSVREEGLSKNTDANTETPQPHGERRTYVGGCRCDLCVEANRVYQRDYMTGWRARHPRPPAPPRPRRCRVCGALRGQEEHANPHVRPKAKTVSSKNPDQDFREPSDDKSPGQTRRGPKAPNSRLVK